MCYTGSFYHHQAGITGKKGVAVLFSVNTDWQGKSRMEYNEIVQNEQWLELRHVVEKTGQRNYSVIAKFKIGQASLADILLAARLLGYPPVLHSEQVSYTR